MQSRRVDHRARSPLQQAELDEITAALRHSAGNKSRAAAELGVGRTSLYRELRQFGLDS